MNHANAEDYKNMIGHQLDGQIVDKEYESRNGLKTVSHFVVSPQSVNYLESHVSGENSCRILTSYGVYTRDFRFNRVNFHVSDEGVVTKVSIG